MSNLRIRQPADISKLLMIALCSLLFSQPVFGNLPSNAPGKRAADDQLFELVKTATGFPFSMFPALGGADKTKWVNDDLINHEELLHTRTFLQGQIAIRKGRDPASVTELEQILQAANFLQKNFVRIATAFDAKGSPAISAEDLETFFAQQKEKYRGKPSQ